MKANCNTAVIAVGFDDVSRDPVLQTSLFSVANPAGGQGLLDHGFQHLLIYIRELLDVEAAFASGVLAELSQQRLGVAETDHVVQNSCGLTR